MALGCAGRRLGAAHAIDVPFVFDAMHDPQYGGADDRILGAAGGPQELADRMHGAWVRFVSERRPRLAGASAVEVLSAAVERPGEA